MQHAGSADVENPTAIRLASPPAHARLGFSEMLIASWGVGGVLALLFQAICRLSVHAWEAHHMPLSAFQLCVSLVWIFVNAYAEGYRAFQLRFSPRVVVRALHVARHPKPLHVALAPLFCMGFFHASRRVLLVAWLTTAMVVGFVVLLRLTPQPWRGIVDGGVVVALTWGAAVIVVLFVRALFGKTPNVSAELPQAPDADR